MFETNSASCGGFVGISDSFGAALWGLDYAMQMAFANFSASLFHVGGQSVFYNPFTRKLFFFLLLYLLFLISFIQHLLPTKVLTDNGPSVLFITLLSSWQKLSVHPTPLKSSISYPTTPTSTHPHIRYMKVVLWRECCCSTMSAIRVVLVI